MSAPDSSLQALLANLRPRSQASSAHLPDAVGTPREASISNLSFTTLPTSPPPPFSPAPSAGNAASQVATAQNLLNLLNFGAQAQPARSASESISASSATRGTHESSFTAADLLRRAAASSASRASPTPRSPALPVQNMQHQEPEKSTEPIHNTDTTSNLAPAFTPQPSVEKPQAATPTGQDTQKPLFTYKNPFEALKASRPHTPQKYHQPTVETPRQETPIPAAPIVEPQAPLNEGSIVEKVLESALPDRTKPAADAVEAQAAKTEQPNPVEQDESIVPETSIKPAPPEATSTPANVAEEAVVEDPPGPEPDLGDKMPETNGVVDSASSGQRIVPVLGFPVKAFVSITMNLKDPSSVHVRENGIMEISRLKKEFDQTDRSLAAASHKFITYALVKNGGMRIIRQEDGKDRQLFKNSHDRIFNVAICTTSASAISTDYQSVIGTGVSGAVYYATLSKPGHDLFDAGELDRESLIFPAFPQGDENTQGGVLKTRAKRSSRHPEFFAIGRGKTINIVWPSSVLNSKYCVNDGSHKVDVERLFTERPLQVLTGKAGKDFSFSEDDTTIVSLDKVGRLRFWDIRRLIDDDNARSVNIIPYVVDEPTLSLSIASPTEKPWPTSVTFVDKNRPYTKGGALRYVLVGLRQNHTLQLWDIALGKAVQELNLPRENDTDAICSVSYHPASGIIVVGHPTRNSIFFIHLSAPRYTLSSILTQATYIARIANKDPDMPKPESTACMSGMREISFAARGQIRSVELLPVQKSPDNTSADVDALFELYVAHATGVTCLVINKEDLGWDDDSKVIQQINAQQEGLVSLKDLKLGSVIEDDQRSKSPAPEPTPSKGDSKKKPKAKKSKDPLEELTNGIVQAQSPRKEEPDPILREVVAPETEAVEPPTIKKEKKKHKQDKPIPAEPSSKNTEVPPPSLGDTAVPRQNATATHEPEQLSMSISGDWLDNEMKKLEKGITTEFKKELDQLYHSVKTDRASQDQASAARQEAVLRVVSSTLNNNVEKTLATILRTQMEEVVVPSVVQLVSTNVSQQIVQTVASSVKKELGSELAVQVDRTLQSPELMKNVADRISSRISGQIEHEIDRTIVGTVAASMKSVAQSAAVDIVAAAETRMADQVAHMSRQHAAFNEKIDQLNGALQNVTSTLQSMMQAQAAFQSQILQDVRHSRAQETARPISVGPASATFSPPPHVRPTPAARPKSQAELEVEEIASLLQEQKYEEGSIKWLQSTQPAKLFDELFVRYTPDYLATDVSPLVAFSIGVTVANNLSTNIQRRVEWITAAFQAVDFKVRRLREAVEQETNIMQDREILELRAHAPGLISTVIQKLETTYHLRAQLNPRDEVVSTIPPLLEIAKELLAAFDALNVGGLSYVSGEARGIIA